MHILLIEDEAELASWLIKALEQSGFTVEWINDGRVAEQTLAADHFDAVILDLGLPGLSGHAVLERIRASRNPVPVIVLTARDTLQERVQTLNKGADDFIPKPFALPELEARLRALMRRSAMRITSEMSCGPLVLDTGANMFCLGGDPLSLTPREHAMLSVLLQKAGKPMSKQRLLDRVFERNEDVSLESIEVLVYRLRKKLAGSPLRIVTMRGFGYCLECDDSANEHA